MNLYPDPSSAKSDIRARLGSAWSDCDLDHLLHLRWLGFKPSAIYDIGSADGSWSAMAHQVFPEARLELFEPLADIADAYVFAGDEHPAIGEALAGARVHPLALGARSGPSKLFRSRDPRRSATWPADAPRGSRPFDMPVHRLDEVIARLGLPAPDLLRLDANGSEGEILEGAGITLASTSVVFVTCWLTKAAGADVPLLLAVANRLAASGFDLFAVGGGSRDEKGVAQTKDAVFVRRGLDLLATHPPACDRP